MKLSVYVGPSKKAVREARRSVLRILSADVSPRIKHAALVAFSDVATSTNDHEFLSNFEVEGKH